MIFDDTTYSNQWTGGFPLGPVPNGRDPRSSLPRFTARPSLGALAPSRGGWQFEPSLPPELEVESIMLLHCGYLIGFRGGARLRMTQVREGVWLGEAPERILPELFSTDKPVETRGDLAWLDAGDHRVGLVQRLENGSRRIALVVDAGDATTLTSRIDEVLETFGTGADVWELELDRRRGWCKRLPETADPTPAGRALEILESRLEPATAPFRHRWARGESMEEPGMQLDELPGLLHALALVRPDTLVDLLKTLAELPVLPDGSWPLEIRVGDAAASEPAAPPVFAMQIAALPGHSLPAEVTNGLSERCAAQIRRFLGEWTPASPKLPDWPEPTAAFTPEIHGAGLELYDLAAVLVAEMDACARLTDGRDLFDEERQALRERILGTHWSPKRKAFLDRVEDGDFTKRLTAATLIPLLWDAPPRDGRRDLQSLLRGQGDLRAPTGIRQWEPRENDPEAPPVRLSTQHLLLPLLNSLPSELSSLLSASWNRLLRDADGIPSLQTASLRIRLLSVKGEVNPELERYPAWVRALERRRSVVVGAAAALLLLLPIVSGLVYMARPELTRQEEYMEAGHAETLYTLKQYADAEEAYTRLLTLSRGTSRLANYHLQRGNARFHQKEYEGALEDYRRAVELDEVQALHTARWNLAQTHRVTGRTDEALRVLREFLEIYGDDLPSIRARAENAIALLEP